MNFSHIKVSYTITATAATAVAAAATATTTAATATAAAAAVAVTTTTTTTTTTLYHHIARLGGEYGHTSRSPATLVANHNTPFFSLQTTKHCSSNH
ncbi:unnamed protein product [Cercopithifilaria johnstoni]|uniref:Uncharacterized protein n=1 Tax=Cercopithifilaria johnstoni TaxID=2874296 RepID=A0A8J2PRR7_9BILA|nr:unnamed protein product [Cercopithifilaria johnstoni]